MPADTRLRYAVYSRGIASITGLSAALGAELVWRPRERGDISAVVAWGRRPSGLVAEKAASTFEVPLIRLEDGFLRSVRPGGNRPLSIIRDGIGIYYDAVRPSGLEAILVGSESVGSPALLERAQRGIERVRSAGLSKYNGGSSLWPRSLEISGETPIALVADQTAGDLSVQLGLAPDDFTPLVERALDECPRALVVVKLHPEVARGRKRGHMRLHAPVLRDARVRILTEDVQPSVLFARAERVYVGTSQLGFDALIAGCQVTCAGIPFYAGWGLTTDLQTTPRRNVRRSLEELAAASWLLYSRYIDPVRRERCEFEDVVEHLALQRDMFERNAGSLVAYGFSAWKKPILAAYLSGPDTTLRFEKNRAPEGQPLPSNQRSVVWGSREVPSTSGAAAVWRVEDGFLRSVGLGSDLSAPASLVVDDQGIYYDARTPSALEQILAGAQFSAGELERARRLRQQIVSTALSKYNLQPHRQLSLAAGDRRIALVIGQVDGDQSLLYGSTAVQTTAALLERVRVEQPGSFLLFRPHPDVLSGNRVGLSSSPLADATVTDASVASCLEVAHEVFTMTSLVGFEALLREIPVTCYGQPFYSGWGLTRDREPLPRRTRRLILDELVAGVLLRYPRYYSFRAEAFVRPEDALDELALAQRTTRPLALGVPRWLRRWTRLLRYLGGRLGS